MVSQDQIPKLHVIPWVSLCSQRCSCNSEMTPSLGGPQCYSFFSHHSTPQSTGILPSDISSGSVLTVSVSLSLLPSEPF
jgi:hypothetical protein